jgi:tetratricopeptide (TPR) repeat protein
MMPPAPTWIPPATPLARSFRAVDRRLPRLLGHLTLVGTLVLGPALAQLKVGMAVAAEESPRPKLSEAQKQEVRDRYDKATRFYYLRKYPEAVAEYEAIYLLSADPVMLYNIAQCHRQNDQPELALQFYKNYLRNAPAATNRADVEKKITEMDRLVEDRRKLAPPAAPVPVQPPAVLPAIPGPMAPASAGAGPEALPVPPPVGGATESGAASDVAAAAPSIPSRVWPITFMVGGGVFLATSVVLGAAAVSKAHQVESAAQVRGRTFDSDLQKTETSGQASSNLAVATGLIGAAALGTGIYLMIRRHRYTEVARGPAVLPVVGAGYAGALARVTF